MASDNFTRANENPLASPWTTWGSFQNLRIVSNLCQNQDGASSVSSGMYYSSSSSLESSLTLSAVGNPGIGNTDAGPACCMSSGGNGYFLGNGGDGIWYIWRIDSNSFSANQSNTAGNWSPGNVAKIAREGNDIVGYHNAVEVVRWTETTYMTGAPGAFIYQGPTRYSLWADGGSGPAATLRKNSLMRLGVGR